MKRQRIGSGRKSHEFYIKLFAAGLSAVLALCLFMPLAEVRAEDPAPALPLELPDQLLTISDQKGEPVCNAYVEIDDISLSLRGFTNAKGQVTIPTPLMQEYVVTVYQDKPEGPSAYAREVHTISFTEKADSVSIKLGIPSTAASFASYAARLELHFQDPDGKPIPNLRVRADKLPEIRNANVKEAYAQRSSMDKYTDENGVLILTNLGKGSYFVTAYGEDGDYVLSGNQVEVRDPKSPSAYTFTASPVEQVSPIPEPGKPLPPRTLIAKDSKGTPLLNAFIVLYTARGEVAGYDYTDSNGRWAIPEPLQGQYTASVTLGNYAGISGRESFTLLLLEKGAETVVLQMACVEAKSAPSTAAYLSKVEITLRDADGKPMGDLPIRYTSVFDGLGPVWPELRNAYPRTDSQGKYTMYLRGGRYAIQPVGLSADGKSEYIIEGGQFAVTDCQKPAAFAFTVKQQAKATANANAQPPEGQERKKLTERFVIVKDKENHLVSNAAVLLTDKQTGSLAAFGYTDSNGRLLIREPYEGDYQVTVTLRTPDAGSNGLTEDFDVSFTDKSTRTAVLSLHQADTSKQFAEYGKRVELLLKDSSGHPLSNMEIRYAFLPEGSDINYSFPNYPSPVLYTDKNGQVILTDLKPGRHAVSVTPQGYETAAYGEFVYDGKTPAARIELSIIQPDAGLPAE